MNPLRHRRQPARQVETAAREEVCRQVVGEDVEETGEQGTAHDPGANAFDSVDEAVADHPDRGGAQGADEDARRHRNRRHNSDDRLSGLLASI